MAWRPNAARPKLLVTIQKIMAGSDFRPAIRFRIGVPFDDDIYARLVASLLRVTDVELMDAESSGRACLSLHAFKHFPLVAP